MSLWLLESSFLMAAVDGFWRERQVEGSESNAFPKVIYISSAFFPKLNSQPFFNKKSVKDLIRSLSVTRSLSH